MLLPGIKINTSPTDFFPIEQMQLMRFDGQALETVRLRPERRHQQLKQTT